MEPISADPFLIEPKRIAGVDVRTSAEGALEMILILTRNMSLGYEW
jgi:hypothetical protein